MMIRLLFLASAVCFAQNGLTARFGEVAFTVDSPYYFLEAGEALHPQLREANGGSQKQK